MSHTPPPWEIVYAGQDDMSQAECIAEEMPVVSIGPINYCEFSADSLGHSEGIQKEYADAHLIKAAPDLLEAARAALRALHSVPPFTYDEGRGEAVGKLADAINKAEARV